MDVEVAVDLDPGFELGLEVVEVEAAGSNSDRLRCPRRNPRRRRRSLRRRSRSRKGRPHIWSVYIFYRRSANRRRGGGRRL